MKVLKQIKHPELDIDLSIMEDNSIHISADLDFERFDPKGIKELGIWFCHQYDLLK